jgi:hypothetical protein
LATGKAKRAAKILPSNQQQTLQGPAGTSSVTRETRAVVQPNSKVDFDVRKFLKRKRVSRDCMHGLIWAWRMLHQKMQKFQRRLFYAPLSSEDNAVIENSKDSVTNNVSNTNMKIVNQSHTLG